MGSSTIPMGETVVGGTAPEEVRLAIQRVRSLLA
jgi:hypothetical protein